MKLKKIMDNLLKRHKTQEQALLELETKTTELFKQNVENNIKQAKHLKMHGKLLQLALMKRKSLRINPVKNVRIIKLDLRQ